MKTWRAVMTSLMFVVGFMTIIYRLYTLQVSPARSVSVFGKPMDLVALARESHDREIVIDSGRGEILDRRGKPLRGASSWRILAFPQTKEQIGLRKSSFSKLAKLIGDDPAQLEKRLTQLRYPVILTGKYGEEIELEPEEKREVESLRIPGVVAVESDGRTSTGNLAKQVIGQVTRNPGLMQQKYRDQVDTGRWSPQSLLGITGIEASFEPFLHGEEWNLLAYTATNTGRPLNGVEMKTKSRGGAVDMPVHTVVTTLDREIQRQVEKILQEENVKAGAAVVQEIATGNILAMASRPDEVDGPGSGLNPWDNRAVMEEVPGSIFKTVVAVAALEEGIVKPDTVFHCNGEWKYGLKDPHKGGHGRETFSQAFANSCNIVMGQVAEKLGGKKLEAYAQRLGLGREVIWQGTVFHEHRFSQLPEEESGLVFANEEERKDPGAVAQSGIGQRSVRVTPIQAANMVTALFHKGKPPQPRLVTEIRDQDGRVVWKFDNRYIPGAKEIREETARVVQRMMRMVVTKGTATSVSGAKWRLAGKTGTAQIGKNGLYNKWMIGFGPADRPRYSVAVVLHHVSDPDDPRAKRVFRRIMDALAELEAAKPEKMSKAEENRLRLRGN
jgi:cell division protein FtsI/penicillin-binding protein 2